MCALRLLRKHRKATWLEGLNMITDLDITFIDHHPYTLKCYRKACIITLPMSSWLNNALDSHGVVRPVPSLTQL